LAAQEQNLLKLFSNTWPIWIIRGKDFQISKSRYADLSDQAGNQPHGATNGRQAGQ
jgi:hypothetical protein